MAGQCSMMAQIATIAFGAGLVLSGCQTLTEDECNVTDWRKLGTADGVAGRLQSHVARHQEACSQYGVTVDVPAWQSGWEEGIRRHCTPRSGLERGLRGGNYSSACPADQAFAYREAFNVGRDAYWAEREVREVQDELDAAIAALAAAAPDERPAAQIAVEVKRSQLFSAEAKARRAERAADRYRASLLATN